MSVTNSINMNLPIPGVGTEAGPTYAFDVNASLTLIDQHDHTPGRGVQITPAGININTDLPFNSNSATSLLNTVFVSQPSATSTLQALSVAPGTETPPLQDLWYTDDAGNKIQITDNGALAAVSTTVQGISYAAGTFFFKETQDSLPTTPANLDAGSVTIRPNTALTANGVRLVPNGGISSQYDLTLPLPVAATAFVTQDSSGLLSGSIPIAGGIQQANLATNSVGTAQIIDGSVTLAKLAVIPVNTTTAAFGPLTLNTTTFIYNTGIGNSITLTAGTWRLTGWVQWIAVTGGVNQFRTGFFGANGANTSATPASVTCTTLMGKMGDIQSSFAGSNAAGFATSIEATITVATTTTVYLNTAQVSTSVANTYQGVISAQQLRA